MASPAVPPSSVASPSMGKASASVESTMKPADVASPSETVPGKMMAEPAVMVKIMAVIAMAVDTPVIWTGVVVVGSETGVVVIVRAISAVVAIVRATIIAITVIADSGAARYCSEN